MRTHATIRKRLIHCLESKHRDFYMKEISVLSWVLGLTDSVTTLRNDEINALHADTKQSVEG